jgi:transposase
MGGERGRRLLRQRGEKLERWNQHLYDRGGMRRVHLRGRENILKRLVVHSGAANLGLLMRTLFGKGTPRGLQGRRRLLFSIFRVLVGWVAGVAILVRTLGGWMTRSASLQRISVEA